MLKWCFDSKILFCGENQNVVFQTWFCNKLDMFFITETWFGMKRRIWLGCDKMRERRTWDWCGRERGMGMRERKREIRGHLMVAAGEMYDFTRCHQMRWNFTRWKGENEVTFYPVDICEPFPHPPPSSLQDEPLHISALQVIFSSPSDVLQSMLTSMTALWRTVILFWASLSCRWFQPVHRWYPLSNKRVFPSWGHQLVMATVQDIPHPLGWIWSHHHHLWRSQTSN